MISMKRFIPFRKHRHSEEEKPVAEEELTAILSTDALIKEVPYRDTRTLVFIYGKPLISSSLTQGGLSGDAHANLNFPLPGGGGAGVATGNGDPLNFYTSPPPLPLAAAYGAASPPVGGGIGSSPAGNSNSHSLAIGGGGANFGANVSPSIGNPSPPLLLSATGGTETAYVQPVILTSLAYIRVVSVCVGETHALFLSDGGEVYSYGEGVYGQLGLGWELQVARQPVKVGDTGPFLKATIHQIACGDYHSVALTTEGAVYCWGAADCVGDGSGFCRYTPVWIRLSLALSSHLHSIPPSSCLAFCRTVAARFQQTMAVTAGGHLLVWGETFFATFHPTPEVLCVFPRAPHYQVIQIAIGKHFGLALTEDGHVYGWGDGTYGELTTASAVNPLTLPRLLNLKDSSGQSLPPVTAIAAGTRHAILRTQDMRLWSFGDNLAGQCGVPGHQTRLSIPKMIKLGELRSRASKVACGFRHSACITPSHQLYMWGHSSNHKLIFTAAAEGICETATQPGVAIRSGLKSSCCRARLIFSMLNLKITEVALGSDTTIVVTGDGDQAHQNLRELAATGSGQEQGEDVFRQTGRESLQLSAPRVITAADLCLLARPAPTAGASATGGVGGSGKTMMAAKTSSSSVGGTGQALGGGERMNTAVTKAETEEKNGRKVEEESDEKRDEERSGVRDKKEGEEKSKREDGHVEVERQKNGGASDVKNTEKKRGEKSTKIEERSGSLKQGQAGAEEDKRKEDQLRQKTQSFLLPVEEDPLQSSSSNQMKASTSGVHTPQNPPQEQSGTVLPLSSSSEQHDGGLHTSETAQAETVHPSINDRSKDTEGYSKRDNFAAKPSGESREVHHSLEKEQNPSTPPGNDKSPLLPTGSGRRELEEHVSRNLDSSPRRSLSRESKDETQEENSPLPASNLFSSRSDSQNVLHGTSNKPE